MNNLNIKNQQKLMRKKRIRNVVKGTSERPRLSVTISLNHVSAQLINDDTNQTLAYASSIGNKKLASNLTAKAVYVGEKIAKDASSKKFTKIVFDRNGKLYHGRIKALAEAARSGGLEF